MEGYIKFYASVERNTIIQLQQTVEELLAQGLTRLHLLISSPGGSVNDGVFLYNFLKGLPIEVITYNMGCVDSIGVVMFCAGNKRISAPHARFLLHPVGWFFENQQFDEHLFIEKLNVLRSDQLNIANIIASTINKPVDEILHLIHTRTTFEPGQAQKEGIVTDNLSFV